MNLRMGILAILLAVAGSALSQDEAMERDEMMKRWTNALELTDHHRKLGKLVGKWTIEREPKMAGMGGKSAGTAEYKWVIPNRWLSSHAKIPMMGMPSETFVVMGYDKVKKKFVSTAVSSNHPGIISTEGPLVDPRGKIEVQYGALDEFLTDEHDKPIKYVTTWLNDDQFTWELWDLGAGPNGMLVLVDTYTRVKE
jgi:hypothetical protein